jgi:hypothetical protein
LQVRVGIATGLVLVGDLIGAGAAQEQVTMIARSECHFDAKIAFNGALNVFRTAT